MGKMQVPFEEVVDYFCARAMTIRPQDPRNIQVVLWYRPEPDRAGQAAGRIDMKLPANIPANKVQEKYDALFNQFEAVKKKYAESTISFQALVTTPSLLPGGIFWQMSISYDENKRLEYHWHQTGWLPQEAQA